MKNSDIKMVKQKKFGGVINNFCTLLKFEYYGIHVSISILRKKIYLNDGYLYNNKPTFVLYLPRIQSYPIWTIIKYDNIVFNNNIKFISGFYGKHDNNIVSNYNNFFKEISNILSNDKNYEIILFYYDEKEKLQSTDKIKKIFFKL